ncbi:cupin domain-containing protein [Nocardia sp. NPDC051570]|uniref:cupin domain-containing protein n=1 Tax=Nocardia sp. NPDC051570 TaxID=3364324 RepID=UPI00379B2745
MSQRHSGNRARLEAIMVGRLTVTTLDEPSHVYAMHGGEKVAQWKCLVRRNNLFGAWEAVEWSWLPPGGASGEHLHNRTEQIDYIVSGSGVMTIDGRDHPVGPGDVILTGLGTSHGLRNVGDSELIWLVSEVAGPVARGVPADDAAAAGDGSNAAVLDLRAIGAIDAQVLLRGPLQGARLVRLQASQTETLVSGTQEHVLFTLDGDGQAVTNSAAFPLRHGVAVGVPLGGSVTLEAGVTGLECYVVMVAVDANSRGAL